MPEKTAIPSKYPKIFCPDSREGDVISFKLEVKDKKTKDEKEKIQGLIRKLAE